MDHCCSTISYGCFKGGQITMSSQEYSIGPIFNPDNYRARNSYVASVPEAYLSMKRYQRPMRDYSGSQVNYGTGTE